MFEQLKPKVTEQFNRMQASGTLFVVDHDRDAIWDAYLNAFPEESRQEHNCNCCKAFIRQIGHVVTIHPDTLHTETLWDFVLMDLEDVPEEYRNSIKALRDYVRYLPIVGLFYHAAGKGQQAGSVGTDRNFSEKHQVIFNHFHVALPRAVQGDRAAKSGELKGTFDVLKRGLEELDPSSFDTVLELMAQNSLYRGADYKHIVEGLKAMEKRYSDVPDRLRENLCWKLASTQPAAVCRARNTAIGTLLIDLSEGKDLETAVAAFERVVAPANYKRPTALVTPRMVEQAKERLTELGLISALERRCLDSRDLTAADALFVHRPKAKATDVFAQLAGEAVVDVKTLAKVEEIGIADFLEKVLPGAQSVKVLLERHQLGNFATLTGPQDPEAKNLFMWDNSYGWSYTGGLADSVKARVKAAGGNVDGWMRISLAWYNFDDLDLHLRGKGVHVYYGDKRNPALQAALDVDMHVGHGTTRTPVENIHIVRQLPQGSYQAIVNNYCARDSSDKGFEVEIEVNGELRHFSSPKSPATDANAESIEFDVAKDGAVSFKDCKLAKSASGITKWGLKTGSWHQVKAVTVSPNYWTRPTTNKHWFFLLEGCVSDEKTRPFYNEFLCRELAAERKVLEVLADKIEVAPADGAELSGLGFSETMRNHVYVEVESAFKRILKVLI